MMTAGPGHHVLFADDDSAATRRLIGSIKSNGAPFNCEMAITAAEAIAAGQRLRPHAAVIDLSIDPDRGPESGLDLISNLVAADPCLRVIVLTGHGSETWGVRALHAGAASFLVKPVDPNHLQALIADAVSLAELKRNFSKIGGSAAGRQVIKGLESEAASMQAALENVALAASSSQPVLIVGETGTGKSVIARSIHQLSRRKSAPFITYQPRYGSPDLVSSELFGHQKGAFTGASEQRRGLVEEAERGTLFLDEVDELPPETQLLLLGVLQDRVFRRLGLNKELKSDFRLITATNRPVEAVLAEGKMRRDFYHRISHVVVELPPLRRRLEDLGSLAESFMRAVVERESLAIAGFSTGAFAAMQKYAWPGNIRELQAAVERAVHRAHFQKRLFVEASDLGISGNDPAGPGSAAGFRNRVREFEVSLIKDALNRSGNNQSEAAKILGLDRSTLRRILEREAEDK